jgi:hypothetical protein
MSEYAFKGAELTFEPTILEEVKATMLGEEYTIPAVKHPHYDPSTTLFAIVIKLHQRVEALEAELKGEQDD